MNPALTTALFHFLWQGAAIAFLLAAFCVFTAAPRARYAAACAAMLAMPLAFVITLALAWPSAGASVAFQVVPFEVRLKADAVSLSLVYAYRCAGWIGVQRLRHRAVCVAPVEWRERLGELARRIGYRGSVSLLESSVVGAPLAAGLWRPVILMPVGLLVGLPTQQVEAILLHELAHIARRDYLVNLLQAAVEGLLFYHPAVWWVSHAIRRERELCCDDVVVAATGDPVSYARALAALEQHRLQLALTATGGPLMYRIQRLLGSSMLGRSSARFATAVPAFVFLLAASAAALFAFQPPPLPPPQPVPPAVPQPQGVPAPAPRVVDTSASLPAPVPALEGPYNNWMNEDVVWIISRAERAEFQGLQTDQDRQRFIQQFWQRRDPTADTEANEAREEHYRRVAWANDRFVAEIPGWKTDRGMVYVKYGPPDEKEEHPVADTVPYPYENWRYRYLAGVGPDVVIEFADPTQSNRYRMTPSIYERLGLMPQPTSPQ